MNIIVLVSGNGTNLQAIIDAINSGYLINTYIKAVISDREAYALERAKKFNIPNLLIDRKIYKQNLSNKILQSVKELESKFNFKTDLIVLAGFLSILNSEFINSYKNRIINIHPALLPSFGGKGMYGKKVFEEVLNSGVKFTGVTIHIVDEGTDTGPIIAQEVIKIDENESLESLEEKTHKIEHKILIDVLKNFSEKKLIIENKKTRWN
ncbi:MAG: phosphoribosylglycinamide formyltransferase [Spirochaetes bacterium]|nr:phosphoribosylglycinamide formyltransferase [Spirochaetota bacterium]